MFVFIAQERRHTEIQSDGMENALRITLITVTALHWPELAFLIACSSNCSSAPPLTRHRVVLNVDHVPLVGVIEVVVVHIDTDLGNDLTLHSIENLAGLHTSNGIKKSASSIKGQTMRQIWNNRACHPCYSRLCLVTSKRFMCSESIQDIRWIF